MPRARTGPVEQRCVEAGARVPLRPGMAAHLAGLGLEDLRLLRGARLRELALLAEDLTVVPRITARWMLDAAEQAGAQGLLHGRRDLSREGFLALAERDLGWATQEPGPRAAALGMLEHLAEVQLLAEDRGRFTWRGPGVVRDLALAPQEEVRARELFGGTLRFYRACLDALPEVLRGKDPPLRFGPAQLPLWEGVLGSPEQLVLRRLGLHAVPGEPQAVLDLACGPGHSTACVVEAFPGADVVAIDFTGAYYREVEERARLSASAMGAPLNLTLAKPWPGWGEALPFPDGSFDLVSFPMNDGFVPLHRRRDVFAEMRRVLRPGGHVAVVSALLPSPAHRPRPWELRAQTWLHHAAEFAVQGFHGLSTAEQHLEALRGAGFAESRPWRFEGLVWVLRA